MNNPFEDLNQRLTTIESHLNDLKVSSFKDSTTQTLPPTFNKIPVKDIFLSKLLSKPTLYAHVKAGTLTLYKLGGRSYVDAKEFDNAFKKVKIA